MGTSFLSQHCPLQQRIHVLSATATGGKRRGSTAAQACATQIEGKESVKKAVGVTQIDDTCEVLGAHAWRQAR